MRYSILYRKPHIRALFGSLRGKPTSALELDKGTRGVAAVEFGLVLWFLMMMLMGIIEYGWVFYLQVNLTNAAREGAREGITLEFDHEPSPLEEAKLRAQAYLEAANIDEYADDPDADWDDNEDRTQIIVTTGISNFKPLIGFLPAELLPSRLDAKSVMRWEWPDSDDEDN